MNEWIAKLAAVAATGERIVLVTVAGIRGSAPREAGAKMLVTAEETMGTIGGGQLEYQCTRVACDLLGAPTAPVLRKFPLGASMGQCCGGVVEVLFEPIGGGLPVWLRTLAALYERREPAVVCTDLGASPKKCIVTASDVHNDGDELAPQQVVHDARAVLEAVGKASRAGQWLLDPVVGSGLNIAVFGAGHVGSAVVRVLSTLDCNIRWFDSRRNIFGHVPASVQPIETTDPASEVAAMPPGASYLVMTHSHALDLDICARILSRGDAGYCGLIGSASKRRQFEKRLRGLGLAEDRIAGLVCPIGVDGISGKKPAEIAVAVAAEQLQVFERQCRRSATRYPGNVRSLHSGQ